MYQAGAVHALRVHTSPNRQKDTMKPKAFIAIIGLVLLGVGMFVGLSSSSISQSLVPDQSCGSAFSPASFVGADFGAAFGAKVNPEDNAHRCSDALSTHRTIALTILGVGALTLLGCAVISSKRQIQHS